MKKSQRQNPCVGPSTTIFNFFVSILLNENRTKSENEREYMYEQKRKGKRERAIFFLKKCVFKKENGFELRLVVRGCETMKKNHEASTLL